MNLKSYYQEKFGYKSNTNNKNVTEEKKEEKKLNISLPSKIIRDNLKLIGKPMIFYDKKNSKEKINDTKPIELIDKSINLKKLAKITQVNDNEKDNPKKKNLTLDNEIEKKNENKKYKEPYKQKSHYLIDKTLKFKNLDSKENDISQININSNKNNLSLEKEDNKKRRNTINKIRKKRQDVSEEVKELIEGKNETKKKSNSEEKGKNSLKNSNFVKMNGKKFYNEKKKIRPINIRKTKLNRTKELYKYQKNTISNSTNSQNYLGKGNNGLDDLETLKKEQTEIDKDDLNYLNIIEQKIPIFSSGYIKKEMTIEKKDITPEKIIDNPITNKLTTALKSSLRKCAPLDTELKFLSKEFKYLLSEQKDKVDKINKIKEEELHKKLEFTPLNNNKINKNENKKYSLNNMDIIEEDIKEEITDEEIINLENDILLKVLEENFNYKQFLDGQLQTIKDILNNKKTLSILPPNSGKSLIYQLVSLVIDGLTIIISPMLSNILNHMSTLPLFLNGASLTSYTTYKQKLEIFEAIKNNKIKILFITPERFIIENIEELKSLNISFICLEDASIACPISSNYRISYLNVNQIINQINPPSLLLLSNMIGPSISNYLVKNYNIEKINNIPINIMPYCNISISKEENKLISLLKILRNQNYKNHSCLIYCNSKKSVNRLSYFLNQNGLNASTYHSGRDEIERNMIQNNFMKEKIKTLICTHNFSSSITQKYVKLVIIFEIPNSIEHLINLISFYREKETFTHIFLSDEDYFIQRKFIYGQNIDKSKLLKFIENIYRINQIKIKKRNYKESTEEITKENVESLPKNICINFNTISTYYDIKKSLQIYLLKSLIENKEINSNDSLIIQGIGACKISIRFYKTSPNDLSEKDNIMKIILKNSNEKQGSFTFNTNDVCNELNISFNEFMNYLYNLQGQGEISYEIKDEGMFIKVNSIPNSLRNIISYSYNLNQDIISLKLTKLNSLYILLRKFATNNYDSFNNLNENNKNMQIKCLSSFNNFNLYNEQMKQIIMNYFKFENENSSDNIIAGNENEKNIILPIYKIEIQRELTSVTKDIEDFINQEIKKKFNVNIIDIINILFGINEGNKDIKCYMSNHLWNKFSNYDYQQIYNICETIIQKGKSNLIDTNFDSKKKLKLN